MSAGHSSFDSEFDSDLRAAYRAAGQILSCVLTLGASAELVRRNSPRPSLPQFNWIEAVELLRTNVDRGNHVSTRLKAELNRLNPKGFTICGIPGTSAIDAALELGKYVTGVSDAEASDDEQCGEIGGRIFRVVCLGRAFTELRKAAKRVESEYLSPVGTLKGGGGLSNGSSATPPADAKGQGEGSGAKLRKPKRRRKRNDPKAEERRKQKNAQDAIDKEIFQDWRRETREDYQDYVDWKNEHLPAGWPQLTYDYVRRAIDREKARLKRLGKWPPKG